MESVALAGKPVSAAARKLTMRTWATPVTLGAFALMSVTGVLMFFGVRGGLISEAHEWLSWVFLAGSAAHLVVNYRPLTLHLKSRWGRLSLAVAAVLLVVAVAPTGIQTGHKLHQAVEQAVVDAPLTTLATLAHISTQDLETRLKARGVAATPEQSARELAERNGVDAREVVAIAFARE